MMTNASRTVELGDLVVALFDEAARYSTDPREVSRLATGAVMRVLLLSNPKALSALTAHQRHRGSRHLPLLIVPSIGGPPASS
jgi:hypothetical protein